MNIRTLLHTYVKRKHDAWLLLADLSTIKEQGVQINQTHAYSHSFFKNWEVKFFELGILRGTKNSSHAYHALGDSGFEAVAFLSSLTFSGFENTVDFKAKLLNML